MTYSAKSNQLLENLKNALIVWKMNSGFWSNAMRLLQSWSARGVLQKICSEKLSPECICHGAFLCKVQGLVLLMKKELHPGYFPVNM